jgi:hypothetical protein
MHQLMGERKHYGTIPTTVTHIRAESIGLLYKKYLIVHLPCESLIMKLLVVLRFTCLTTYGNGLTLYSLCGL